MNTHPVQPRIWYPVSVKLGHVPPVVRWVDLSGVAFDEPFFHHTVYRLAERESLVLPMGATSAGEAQPWPSPSAFVFQVLRCGSTLLCNIFRAPNDTHVVAKPRPVMALLGPYAARLWPCTEAEWAPKRDALLLQMMQRLGPPATSSATRYIVKLASYGATRMEMIRALWPDVSILFLVRDPAKVMVPNQGRKPVWMNLLQRPAQARNKEATKTYSRDAYGEARFNADGRAKGDCMKPTISKAAKRWARPALWALFATSNKVQP